MFRTVILLIVFTFCYMNEMVLFVQSYVCATLHDDIIKEKS